MRAKVIKIYKKILEDYSDKWFTTYDICGARVEEEFPNEFTWNYNDHELKHFNRILNILTSTSILKRKREYAELDQRIKKRYYMFYKLEKDVDMKIIRAMDTLYEEGYYSNTNICDVKLVHVDDNVLSDINERMNKLEESNKVFLQEFSKFPRI